MSRSGTLPKPITYQPLDDIGVNGLNTQNNPSTLDHTWLTKAENVVLRESGRISFRKGFKQQVLKTSAKIGSLTEHNDQGTNKIFASSGDTIYTIDFTTPDAAFPSSGADVKRTVSGTTGDWQFVNFNKRLHCFHAGATPQRYDGSLASGSRWTAHATQPTGITTFDPSCGMGFYGRVWCGGVAEEKSVVFHSNLLDGDDWTGGDASSINLNKVWGNDEIVALAPFYGKLVIFGKNNIAIYNNPDDVTALALDEVIRGIGCVSRDSVQAIADDLVFLSSTGLRSLGRTTEKDKLPLTDYSVNIKDRLIRNIAQSTNVKSVYVESEGIYIMSFVDKNITYVFDMKHSTPNAAPRITTWTFDSDREPASLAYTELYGLLIGQQEGSLATYEGYFDKDYSGSSVYVNSSYTSGISTIWVNLGENVSASLLKRLFMVLEGGSGATMGVKWYKDFSQTPSKTTQILLNPTTTGSTALWGSSTSLYGASKFTPIYGLSEYKTHLTGSAKHLKLDIDIESNGFDASLQNLTILHKQGKLR